MPHRKLLGCQVFRDTGLPPKWRLEPLRQYIELAYGFSLPDERRNLGPIRVFGSNGRVGSHDKIGVAGPGVLIGRKGTVGAVHFTSDDFWPIDTVYYVRLLDDHNLRFVYHLLSYLPLNILNAATGVPGLSRRDAYALLAPFPPPEEQAAIARILDVVDTAIQCTQNAIHRARDLQTSLTNELIDKLGAPLRRLGEFAADVRYGTSNASNTNGWGHPALRIPNVLRGELSIDDLSYVEVKTADSRRLMLRDGDLLLVRTNGNPHYVGRSVVFHPPDGRHWIYASYLIRVRLGKGLSPEYANLVLGLERGRRELLRRVTTSAGNCNINSNSIRLVRLPVPTSESDQMRVVEAGHAVRAVQEVQLFKLRALNDLKRSLMHALLTGKVRTDQLKLDGVAA